MYVYIYVYILQTHIGPEPSGFLGVDALGGVFSEHLPVEAVEGVVSEGQLFGWAPRGHDFRPEFLAPEPPATVPSPPCALELAPVVRFISTENSGSSPDTVDQKNSSASPSDTELG